MKVLILWISFCSIVSAKTSVQTQSIELKPASTTHSLIQICTEYECETLGSHQGYTQAEIQEMFNMNSQIIKKMNYEKWFVSIGMTIIGSYLYKWGKIVASVGVGVISFPQIKSWDEKIEIQQALEQRPQLLADGNYQLSPEAFSLVKEALVNAVEVLERCLTQNELYYGVRGFDYCQTGYIPNPGNDSLFYGYP